MKLPTFNDLLPEERKAKVDLSTEELVLHPAFYFWPFEEILEYVSTFPAPPPETDWESETGEFLWDGRYHGYRDWAIPDSKEANENPRLELRMLLANRSTNAEVQIKKLFATPIERMLTLRSETSEHVALQEKIFVIKFSLSPFNSSHHDDFHKREEDTNVRVWRLITCFGETTLNTLHDRILGPAMGWVRHYHSYKYIIPTNGACFGPKSSDAIDSMHGMRSYTLDDSKYQLAHVLREPGQRVVYIYDLGDNWFHNIELIQVVNRGDMLQLPNDEQVRAGLIERYGSELPRLNGVHLLAGEMNCPPEDSNGCGGSGGRLGRYGNLLKKGPKHKSYDATTSANWKAHKVKNAYKFNLSDHAARLADAIAGKSSAKSGHKMCITPGPAWSPGKTLLGTPAGMGEKVKEHGAGGWTETVKTRPDNRVEAVCANCGRQPNVEFGAKPLLRCGGCKSARYCGQSCQKGDWDSHKAKCRAMKKERLSFKKEESENLSHK